MKTKSTFKLKEARVIEGNALGLPLDLKAIQLATEFCNENLISYEFKFFNEWIELRTNKWTYDSRNICKYINDNLYL